MALWDLGYVNTALLMSVNCRRATVRELEACRAQEYIYPSEVLLRKDAIKTSDTAVQKAFLTVKSSFLCLLKF